MKDDRTTAAASIIADERDPGDASGAERAFLVVYHGQGGDSRGYVVPVHEGTEVSIGRLETCTISVDHELVSRWHARILRHGADVVVEDRDSRNGTRVNGVRITGPTRISSGDEITIGPASIIVGVTTSMRQHTQVGSNFELEERLAAELDRAARYRRPLGLTMVRFHGSRAAVTGAVEAIGNSLRKMDYLARYGPDEFAVILPESDRAATERAAQHLVEDARVAGAQRGGIHVHVGLAVCPEDGAQVGELVSRARAALRAARAGGGVDAISRAPKEETPPPGNIVVVAPIMKRVFALARKVADTPITVLVLGETGAGKEIVANAIHQQSARAPKPFQALNCSALPETLLESELFGHERGAFTGADRRKIGYFEAAQGGTIFLDEVGEMPLGVQAKLLRVLEQRTITRVGGTAPVQIDARVVCATNRDLEAEARQGRFREDLYFRISAFTLVVPPLRDRRSEILPLASHFARHFALELGQPPPSFSREAREVLEHYSWPGNVRELRNAIERAVVLEPGGIIGVEHLPERLAARVRARAEQMAIPQSLPAIGGSAPAPSSTAVAAAESTPPSPAPSGVHATASADPSPERPAARGKGRRGRRANVSRAELVAALDTHDGNQTRAAKELGISRWALIRLMQKFGLKKTPSA